MKISTPHLTEAAVEMRLALGDTSDLSYELQNTLANVFYKKSILKDERILKDNYKSLFPASADNAITAYKNMMYESANIIASYQGAPRLIDSLREIKVEEPYLFELINEVTIDTLKYNINNAHKKTRFRRVLERKFKKVNEIKNLIDIMEDEVFSVQNKKQKKSDINIDKSHNNDIKINTGVDTVNQLNYGIGKLVEPEIARILKNTNAYLSSFGERKPKSITLNPYDWALLDIWLRDANDNDGGLHSKVYENVTINCQSGRCYCHKLFSDIDILKLCNELFDSYLVGYELNHNDSYSIGESDNQKINSRIEYFFDGVISYKNNPKIVLKMLRAIGSMMVFEPTNYEGIIWQQITGCTTGGQKFLVSQGLIIDATYSAIKRFPETISSYKPIEQNLKHFTKFEYKFSDYIETGKNNFINPTGVVISKNYYSYLSNIKYADELTLKSSGEVDPIVLFDGEKKIGVQMPFKE